MEYETDFIMKVNIMSLVLIGILQFLIYLINSNRHLKLAIKSKSRIATGDQSLRILAWKRQINFFCIPIVILGFSNFVFYLIFFNLIHNYWIGATSLLMTIPIFGYFESLNELKEIYLGKCVSYSIKTYNLEYRIGNKIISYDLKKLNYLQKNDEELVLIDTTSKRKIILILK